MYLHPKVRFINCIKSSRLYLRAFQEIQPGECVLRESPLLAFDRMTPDGLIDLLMETLPLSAKHKCQLLYKKHGTRPLHNGLEGVFFILTQIPSSCDCNCVSAWQKSRVEYIIVATRHINIDDPITVDFTSLSVNKETCALKANHYCKLKNIDDSLLSEFYTLDKQTKDIFLYKPKESVEIVNRIVFILNRIGHTQKAHRYYYLGFRLCFFYFNYEAAREWAAVCLKSYPLGVHGELYVMYQTCVELSLTRSTESMVYLKLPLPFFKVTR